VPELRRFEFSGWLADGVVSVLNGGEKRTFGRRRANSFTEGQAKARIESRGYSNVSNLKQDDMGVWRGKADKDQKSMDVSLDFQGNVTAP
jgi:hypothetical protein